MSEDKPVLIAAIGAAIFLVGVYAGEAYTEQRYADSRLTPCPKQQGYLNTSAVWSKTEGQQCFYRPKLEKLPGKRT